MVLEDRRRFRGCIGEFAVDAGDALPQRCELFLNIDTLRLFFAYYILFPGVTTGSLHQSK